MPHAVAEPTASATLQFTLNVLHYVITSASRKTNGYFSHRGRRTVGRRDPRRPSLSYLQRDKGGKKDASSPALEHLHMLLSYHICPMPISK